MISKSNIYKLKYKLQILFGIILFLSLSFPRTIAQTGRLDSLTALLKNLSEDTSKANTFIALAWELRSINKEKAIKYGVEAVSLSEKINYQKGKANAYNSLGAVYYSEGNYKKAIEYYINALTVFEEIGKKNGIALEYSNIGNIYYLQTNFDKALIYFAKSLRINEELKDKKKIAKDYGNIGMVFYDQGQQAKALDCYLISLRLREETGDKQGAAYVLGNIGLIYDDQKNYPKSLEYYNKSLKINEEIGDDIGVATSLINIGSVYTSLDDFKNAVFYNNNALKIYEEIGYKNGIESSLNNLGDIYKKQKNYPQALYFYKKSLVTSEELGDKKVSCTTQNSIGEIYLQEKNYNEALLWFQKSLAQSIKINLKEMSKLSYLNIAETYALQGKYNFAYENLKCYDVMKDSIYNTESIGQIVNMQTKYDTEKKEEEIKLLTTKNELQSLTLNRNRIIIASFIIGSVLLIILVFVALKAYQQKQKDNKLLQFQKEIIAEEKQKSENLLLNILPFDTAEELKITGKATPRSYKKVTVLFTDFKGFTKLAEQIEPEELISELDFCFRKFDEIIAKFPIEKIKTIGDSYMCAGGLPVANDSNPNDVVNAALEICAFMTTWKEEKIRQGKPSWEVRIGIHTGSVVAGVVGTKKFAYDIWGDTVNTASRIESSGEPNKVNISDTTYELIKENFICNYRGKITAKGKGEIDMYFVEQRK